mgnify:CR=1 FL=1
MLHTLNTGTHIPRTSETVCDFHSRSHVHAGTCIPLHVQRELHFRDNRVVEALLLLAKERAEGSL